MARRGFTDQVCVQNKTVVINAFRIRIQTIASRSPSAVAHKRRRVPRMASEFALAADEILQCIRRCVLEPHVLSEMNKTIACTMGLARTEPAYDQ